MPKISLGVVPEERRNSPPKFKIGFSQFQRGYKFRNLGY